MNEHQMRMSMLMDGGLRPPARATFLTAIMSNNCETEGTLNTLVEALIGAAYATGVSGEELLRNVKDTWDSLGQFEKERRASMN